MTTFLAALITGVVASAVLTVAVWLALRVTPRRVLNASTRYVVWWLTLVVVMALPIAYLPWESSANPAHTVATRGDATPALLPQSRPAIRIGLPVVPDEAPQQSRQPLFPFVFETTASMQWIFLAWILLTTLLILRLIVSCVLLGRRKARAAAAPEQLASQVSGWLLHCGSKRRDVRLLSSSEIATPMVAGFRRPAILMPARLLEELSDDQLNQIGLHETAHLARGDDYALILQRVIEAFLAWHPIVRWIARRIDLEREIACDDFVVQAIGNAKPYAICLTRVVELAGAGGVSLIATAAIEERSHLATRVAILLDRTRHTGTQLLKARLAVVAAALLALAAGTASTPRLIVFAAPFAAVEKQAEALQQPPAPIPSTSPTPASSPEPTQPALFTIPANVTLGASVRDDRNRFVTGLDKDHFKLLEDGVEQEITQFSNTDAAISVGIVIDSSGAVRQAVARFLAMSNRQDEYFLLKFADRAEMLVDFTSNTEEIQNKLASSQAVGKTALLDGIYLALSRMKHAKNARTAMLVFSDGGDNTSRYSESEIRALVRETGVTIYAISLPSLSAGDPVPERDFLREIADQNYGRQFEAGDSAQLADVAAKIAVELHNLYTFSYNSTKAPEAYYRRIKLELITPRGFTSLHVIHRP